MAGVGIGGTITGVSQSIKRTLGKPLVSVAVEPVESPVIQRTLADQPVEPGLQKIQRILSCISSGAAAAVAVKLAHDDSFAGKTIVVVLPDSGERYQSLVLFEGIFKEQGLPA